MTVWLALKFYTENYSLHQILFDLPIIIAKTIIAFFAVRWIIQRYIAEKKQYFLAIILCIIALVITGFADMLRDHFGMGNTWSNLPSWGYLFIHSFYYSAGDVSAPFVLLVGKKYYDNQILLINIKEKQKDSELKLLRAQLSPHFLFNNLNTVDALIDTDPKKAKAYISRLSSLYRYLISTKDLEMVPLEDELAMAQDYFYLIETRFGDAYQFKIGNTRAFAKAYLPSGALQTILENVIKHNNVTTAKPVITELNVLNGTLILRNTKGVSPVENLSLGTGLKNLKERYELLLGNTVEVIDTPDQFIVKLPLTQLQAPS